MGDKQHSLYDAILVVVTILLIGTVASLYLASTEPASQRVAGPCTISTKHCM